MYTFLDRILLDILNDFSDGLDGMIVLFLLIFDGPFLDIASHMNALCSMKLSQGCFWTSTKRTKKINIKVILDIDLRPDCFINIIWFQ